MRHIIAVALLLLSVVGGVALSAVGAVAQESDVGRAIAAEERAEEARGLPSIADEAAEVRADDEAGLGEDDRPAGGMSRVEDELNEAEDEDGCTGAMGAECPGGDN